MYITTSWLEMFEALCIATTVVYHMVLYGAYHIYIYTARYMFFSDA